MKDVVIRLGDGRLLTGFNNVSIELKVNRETKWEDRASLIAAPNLERFLRQWELMYPVVLNSPLNQPFRSPQFDDAAVTNIAETDVKGLNQNLRRSLNDWLDQGTFAQVVKRLREELNPQDQVVVTIVADQQNIWNVPWHFWDFFDAYRNAVEVFWKPKSRYVAVPPRRKGRVNILSLFGNDPKLALDDGFSRSLPQAYVEMVGGSRGVPSMRDIANFLNKSHLWDIFIFDGHGNTFEYQQLNLREGVIYLDKQTPVEISRLKTEVAQAVQRGLQIAIFNCCSGLGLAEQLTDVSIPYIIVMREKIPDWAAQQFLSDLLMQYSHGNSLPEAFRYARGRLILTECGFAQFADWLPVLFHNHLSPYVSWQDLASSRWSLPVPESVRNFCRYWSRPRRRIWAGVVVSLLVCMLVLSLEPVAQWTWVENLMIDQVQAFQSRTVRPDTSQISVVKFDCQSAAGMCKSSEQLVAKIEQISRQANPLLWIVDIDFDESPSRLVRPNVMQGCTDTAQRLDQKTYDRSELECDRESPGFGILSEQPFFQQISQPFWLNHHLLGTRETINIEDVAEFSGQKIQQLFAGKIVLVGNSNEQDNDSWAVRDAMALEAMTRAVAKPPISLIFPGSKNMQVGWIFGWSVLMAIAIWRRYWLFWVIAMFVIHAGVVAMLLLSSLGVPVVMGVVGMLLTGGLMLWMKSLAINGLVAGKNF